MKKFFSALLLLTLISCAQNHKESDMNNADNWIGEPNSGFRNLQASEAKKYMIVSGNKLASEAGEKVLAKGGNVIDAIIAAQMVLNVVEPHSSGIGGGGLLIYYDAKTKKTTYFNGRERAPKTANEKIFLDKNGKPMEFSQAVQGGLSVGTPGLLAALRSAYLKHGRTNWSSLFEPAIKIANDGFEVSERFSKLSKQVSYLNKFDETAEIYLDQNRQPYEPGAVIKNPKLAKTLGKISKDGIDIFYHGSIARDIATSVQNSKVNPGHLSLSDMKSYRSKIGNLICRKYRDHKICTTPLPSGGITLLQILGILENFDLAKLKPNSKDAVHLISEATRLAYADRNEYVADISGVPVAQMLDKNYLKKRASLIKPNQAMEKVEAGKFASNENLVASNETFELPSTTHLSAIDKEGNAIALTSSIEYFFGSALSVDGFLLNNQLTDFAFEPKKNGKKVANRLEPGKQPRSSMAPTFVFDKNDKLVMVVGSPGGPRIIQFVLKEIVNYLDFGLDVQQSISIPTFVILNDVIELERNQNITNLRPWLQEIGHKVTITDIVSGINSITIEDDKIKGGSDPRREGFAVGK